MKKKALEKNAVIEVLVVYTLISLVFCVGASFFNFLNGSNDVTEMNFKLLPAVIFKSFIIFVAWICGFKAIKKLPVSIYGILDMARVIFSTILSVIILSETLGRNKILGILLVCLGLLLLKFKPGFLKKLFRVTEDEKTLDATGAEKGIPVGCIVLAFISCFLNALSGTMDKMLMQHMTSSQLQLWYTFFLAVFYILYILFTRTKISASIWKNLYVYILAIMFVIGDRALFIGNAMEGSTVIGMTLVKQSCCLVTIIGGRLVFKEKNMAYRIFCAIVIVSGILAGMIP